MIITRQLLSQTRSLSCGLLAECLLLKHCRRYGSEYTPIVESEIIDVPQLSSYEHDFTKQQIQMPFLKQLRPGESIKQDVQIGANTVEFEVGNLARIANGSCMVTVGNTKVLATVVLEEEMGFFTPTEMQLSVDFRTPSYATGKIPFTPTKREGAPTDMEVMGMNAVEKAIKPLFPPGLFHRLQVQVQVLSADGAQDPVVHAISAASQALMSSDIPWGGPVGAVRVCRIRDSLLINPTLEDQELSSLNLLYALTTDDHVVMLETEGKQVPENTFIEALQYAHQEAQNLLEPQLDITRKSQMKKRALNQLGSDFTAYRIISQFADPILDNILNDTTMTLANQQEAFERSKAVINEKMFRRGALRREQIRTPGSGCASNRDMIMSFDMCLNDALRRRLFRHNLRIDNRSPGDQKTPFAEINTVPIVHGSSVFQRGETQALTTCTVGGRSDILREQTIVGFSTNRLIANISQNGYATREVVWRGSATKGEIAAGQVVQQALEAVMPSPMKFPFPSRINSEILAQGGSALTSAICGGALALKDAGVPIESDVVAVNVGFMHEQYPLTLLRELPQVPAEVGYDKIATQWGRCEHLLDMSALEEKFCDGNMMLAATKLGVTMVDFSSRLCGIPYQSVIEAFLKAYKAREESLDFVQDLVQRSADKRGDSDFSRFGTITIDKDNVTRLIGIGGTNLRKIIDKTDCRILVDSNGEVKIYAPTRERYEEAVALVKEIDGSVEVGQTLVGKISNVTSFGVFLQFPDVPSSVGAMLHISEIAHDRRNQTTQGFTVGDSLEVKIIGKDQRGNFQLSRKALLPLTSVHEPPEDFNFQKLHQDDNGRTGTEMDDLDKLSDQAVFGENPTSSDALWNDHWRKPSQNTNADFGDLQDEEAKGFKVIRKDKGDWEL